MLKYEAMWIEFLTQGFDVMRIYGKGDLDLLIRDLDILFDSLDPDNMPAAFMLTAADFTAKEPLPLLPAPPPVAGVGVVQGVRVGAAVGHRVERWIESITLNHLSIPCLLYTSDAADE